jgi:hypothetical protein
MTAAEALAHAQRDARNRETGTHSNLWAAFQILSR